MMSSQIKITIPIEPVGKGRPRMTRKGFVYTPINTRHAESMIRNIYLDYARKNKLPVIDRRIPLSLQVQFHIRKPKSISKKIKYPTKKPDIDNYLKLVMDALNGYAYQDDSQIIEVIAEKRYAVTYPCIEITIIRKEDK